MRYRTTRYLPLCALFVLAACQTTSDPLAELRAHKPTPTEILQQATSLAIGNLAWESVNISAVEKVDGRVRWLATTRSEKYRCTADADGQNSFCER
ncbi:MAG: hypothetical protein JWN66_65 [Sphingomonas bacterium]|uniref:hypothetical protein n=1 Tax=Sphingomonas bacterium TaxID=1895847 RepID=UPI0026029AAF|nr:hypothetical protein [Sphingomonas bacterium]MDB5702949.1 hypothetical protein [Sphingomonas bacterium]